MFFPFVRISVPALALALPLLLLGACSSTPLEEPPLPPVAVEPPPPPAPPRVQPVEAEPVAPAAQPASLFTFSSQGPLPAMLAYADKLRNLNGAELAAELTRLGDPGESPVQQMQVALALAQTRVPADLARALGLMQRVNASPVADAKPLQALARALAARYVEQRRVEDDRDRQAQQVRESQRRIEQLSERLEALRAIERSFTRPNNAPPAPPNGAKPAQ
jgi:hypothetical protein